MTLLFSITSCFVGAPVPLQVICPAKLWCDLESAPEAQELSHLFDVTLVPSFTGVGGWVGVLLWLEVA